MFESGYFIELCKLHKEYYMHKLRSHMSLIVARHVDREWGEWDETRRREADKASDPIEVLWVTMDVPTALRRDEDFVAELRALCQRV